MNNIFKDIPPQLEQEQLDVLLQNPQCRLERIVSRGQQSPEGFWYEQEEDEWVLLLSGSAELTFAETGKRQLQTGDYLLIPKGQRHRVSWTSTEPAAIWLCLFVDPA